MFHGIDISNWDGNLTPEFVDCLTQSGIKHVVVRASLETPAKGNIARQQLQALTQAGLLTSVYIWMYSSWDPVQTVQSTYQLVEGFPETKFWLDCEETSDVGAPAANADWIRRAVAEIKNQGRTPGIYTGAWWWTDPRYMANSTEFADVRLWAADYDGIPNVLQWVPFGGWQVLTGKQYLGSGTGSICGMAVDLDVFVDSYGSSQAVLASAAADHSAPPDSGSSYVVRSGDTLGEIAGRFGVDLSALRAANPQITDPNLIYPGQQLTIPPAGSGT
jgi:spore coat assembly protein SafA